MSFVFLVSVCLLHMRRVLHWWCVSWSETPPSHELPLPFRGEEEPGACRTGDRGFDVLFKYEIEGGF